MILLSRFQTLNVLMTAFAVVATVSLPTGCGNDRPSKPDVRGYDEIVEAGWAAFSVRDYDLALAEFKSAVSLDITNAEGFRGVGWASSLIDSLYLARYAFLECLERNPALVDPLVGLAGVYRDVPDFRKAIEYGNQALEADPSFVFEHRTSYDWRDVRLILATCYFAVGEYENAYGEIHMLDPELELDPDSESFVENLLREIEELVFTYGGI